MVHTPVCRWNTCILKIKFKKLLKLHKMVAAEKQLMRSSSCLPVWVHTGHPHPHKHTYLHTCTSIIKKRTVLEGWVACWLGSLSHFDLMHSFPAPVYRRLPGVSLSEWLLFCFCSRRSWKATFVSTWILNFPASQCTFLPVPESSDYSHTVSCFEQQNCGEGKLSRTVCCLSCNWEISGSDGMRNERSYSIFVNSIWALHSS